jgi:hypothetical protein
MPEGRGFRGEISMSAQHGFRIIGEEDPPTPAPDKDLIDHNRTMLLLALKALSQRAATAITNLMTLVMVSGVGFLAWTVLPNPTNPQLWLVGGFAFFVLLIDIARRRR